jgi:PhnB protein
MNVPTTPTGYHTITPYLYVKGGEAALEFYQRAFGAEVMMTLPMPGGVLGHAEFRIGDSVVMLADEQPSMGVRGPVTLGGNSSSLMIYLPDVDRAFDRAIAAGGEIVRPVADQFYGDRSGQLKDPFGHVWTLATHVEDVTPEEVTRRMAKMFGGES